MKIPSSDFEGWTLNDAVFRCVDADALRRYHDSMRALNTPPPPRQHYGHGFEMLEYVEGLQWAAEARRRFLENGSNHIALIHLLHDLLERGRLVAWGKKEKASAERFFISISAWSTLKLVHMRESIAEEPRKPETKIFEIRVFPVLRSPNAPDLISKRSLVEVFRDLVLHDPEVEARGKEATWAHPEYASTFVDGRQPSGGMDEWSVTWGDDCWREQRRSSGANPPLEVVSIAMDRLADRFRALVTLLRSGQVKAWGVPNLATMKAEIPRPLWSNPAFHFRGGTGEFFEQGTDPAPVPARSWVGLMIVRAVQPVLPAPSSTVDREPPIADLKRQARHSAEDECQRWLEEIMARHKEDKRHAKAHWRDEALAKWPNVSRRAFDRAWTAAVKKTNAPLWSRGGAPRKSPQ